MSTPIRVLIADDQALVRGALATLLGLEPDIEVVAQTGSGRAVAALAREHAVDVALLDIDMPDMDGLAAAAALTASGAACRSLIVAILRIASASSWGGVSLTRNPEAPASRARER